MPIKERIKKLRWAGFNPIHLWGNVYLIRYWSTVISSIPFYTIKVLKE